MRMRREKRVERKKRVRRVCFGGGKIATVAASLFRDMRRALLLW
jgi:hypothetical protein